MSPLALAAAVVLIEIGSGRVLRQEGEVNSQSAPGSTIKPFVLQAVTKRPERLCARYLAPGGRRMHCTHPVLARPLSADDALAYSCNSYFGYLAQITEPAILVRTLKSFGFVFSRAVETSDARQLAALGEYAITISPMDLARAYAKLAAAGGEEGLRAAVEFGTAQQAAVPGLTVAGKTGTTRGHAWFAGYAPAEKPRVAVAVMTSEGTGGGAAAPVAAKALKQWFASQQR